MRRKNAFNYRNGNKTLTSQLTVTKRYRQSNLQRMNIEYKLEAANKIREYCKYKNIPVSTFVKIAIKEKLERDGYLI